MPLARLVTGSSPSPSRFARRGGMLAAALFASFILLMPASQADAAGRSETTSRAQSISTEQDSHGGFSLIRIVQWLGMGKSDDGNDTDPYPAPTKSDDGNDTDPYPVKGP